MILDHVIEDSVIASLYKSSMVRANATESPELMISHDPSPVALRGYELSLHPVGDRLVSMVPDRCSIGSHASNSTRVESVLASNVVKCSWQVYFTIIMIPN